jgi:predicted RNase H-like HicB family nuclease
MITEYPINLYLDSSDKEAMWVAEYPDLPGCIGVGKTKEEALNTAEVFKAMWLETAAEIGKQIPEPRESYCKNYSGKFNIRVSKDLHRRLALESELQDVSMNSLCERYLDRGLEQDRLFHSISFAVRTIEKRAKAGTTDGISRNSDWDNLTKSKAQSPSLTLYCDRAGA